jgi:flagellin-like hook-associated protein FlgL
MAMDITLSASMRQNLLSLQQTSSLFNTTQNRLATGLKVGSAVDDPSAFFTAFAARNRASDLSTRKQEMGEAIQAVKAANAGITAVTGLLQTMNGVIQSARSASTTDRATLQTQFNTLRTQLDQAVADSNYKGTNFLNADTLTVSFNGSGTSTLDIKGFTATSSGLGVVTAGGTLGGWSAASFNTVLSKHTSQINSALSTLRTQSQALAANLGVVTLRQDYTDSMVATLKEGADKLTLADQNEEGANMLALQTRQQLGIISLQLASQANQGILRLF